MKERISMECLEKMRSKKVSETAYTMFDILMSGGSVTCSSISEMKGRDARTQGLGEGEGGSW